MLAYSMDLRLRVLTDVDAGMQTGAVAAKYSVSPAWVRRLKQRRTATGQIGPTPQKRGVTPGHVLYGDRIREAVRQAPDATLAEFRAQFGLPLSRSALARAPVALGLVRKKSRSGRPSRTARMSRPSASRGGPTSPASTRTGSSSSTRRGPPPT
jgi:transposase